MKTTRILLAIALVGVTSCADFGTAPPLERSLDDIREAVFRYQFFHNASALQQTAQVYFISLFVPGDSLHSGYYVDPSDELMIRFAGNVPPVKRFSECSRTRYGVFDLQTGARGLLFRVESIKEISADEVEVTGGYFEGGLSASGNIYTVRRIQERWTVIKDVFIWIS